MDPIRGKTCPHVPYVTQLFIELHAYTYLILFAYSYLFLQHIFFAYSYLCRDKYYKGIKPMPPHSIYLSSSAPVYVNKYFYNIEMFRTISYTYSDRLVCKHYIDAIRVTRIYDHKLFGKIRTTHELSK